MNGPRFSIVAAMLHDWPDHLMSDDPYEGFLKAKEAALLAELASVRATLADVARHTGKPSEQPPATEDEKSKPKRSSRDKANPYLGLTLSDAVVGALEASTVPLTTGQIWAVLHKAGVEPMSDDPVKSVTWALRKRALKQRDVVHVAHGKWNLRSRHSDTQLRKLAKRNTGIGGATRDDHAARTKAGIERRRAAGGQIGQPLKMTPELRAEADLMIRDGDSIARVARELGVSVGTIRNHYSRDDVVKLRAEGVADRERESESETSDDEPGLRVVK